MILLAFHATGVRGHYDVVDRRTGEFLGSVWRTGSGWSAEGPDGALRVRDRLGHRQGCGEALVAALIAEGALTG